MQAVVDTETVGDGEEELWTETAASTEMGQRYTLAPVQVGQVKWTGGILKLLKKGDSTLARYKGTDFKIQPRVKGQINTPLTLNLS